MKRYQGKVTQYKQNRLFVDNRHQLYKELDRDAKEEKEAPDADVAVGFWSNIWTNQQNTIRWQHG